MSRPSQRCSGQIQPSRATAAVIAGFLLWGYPSSPNPEFASVSPLGQLIGAVIMFFVLGFIPGWVTAKILNGFGLLRIPRQVELMGLDTAALDAMRKDETAIIVAERELVAVAGKS